MPKLEQELSGKQKTLHIDMKWFDPLDPISAIQAQLDALLQKKMPQIIVLNLPSNREYAIYGAFIRETVLPYLLIKSGDFGYKVRMDRKAHDVVRIQFGKALQGDYKGGYHLCSQPGY